MKIGFARILVLMLCIIAASFSQMVGQVDLSTPFGQKITEAGYQPQKVTDWSNESKIHLPKQPRLAYINIVGVDSAFTQTPVVKYPDGQQLHAYIEVYDGEGNYFRKRILFNGQGSSSFRLWPKKNFAVSLCEDDFTGDKETKLKIGDWVTLDTYHFKANYIDHFRATNSVGYKILEGVYADRQLPWQKAGIECKEGEEARCFPDGFPCLVYLEGEFYGIYAWSLTKNRKNMALKKKEPHHIHLDGWMPYNEFWYGPENISWDLVEVRNPGGLVLNTKPNMIDGKVVPVSYDTDNPHQLMGDDFPDYDAANEAMARTAAVKRSIRALSNACIELDALWSTATKQEMRDRFSQRFDLESMIDYYCFSLVTSNFDGFNSNWQWVTYDGEKWFAIPYDLDAIFGVFNQGYVLYPAEWSNGRHESDYRMELETDHGPFFFLKRLFADEIRERYWQLRADALSEERMFSIMKQWVDAIGPENYALEFARWPESFSNSHTFCNPRWKTVDDWTRSETMPQYDPDRLYQAGDSCKAMFRIWVATAPVRGVCPYRQVGFTDSLERVKQWLHHRLELEDEYIEQFSPSPLTYHQNVEQLRTQAEEEPSDFFDSIIQFFQECWQSIVHFFD